MKRRRVLPAATVSLTVATALLLTGCGGDDGDSGDGAKERTPQGSSRADGAGDGDGDGDGRGGDSAAPKLDRPAMNFPSDIKLTFEKAELSDPTEAAALKDAENYARSTVYGIVKQDPENAAYKFYSVPKSPAREYGKYQIGKHASGDLSLAGERRHSDAKVRPEAGGSGKGFVVTFCSDESRIKGKDLKSGRTFSFEPGPQNQWFWTIDMVPSKEKDKAGLWLANRVEVKTKAAQCR
ncbi:hypothetical protein IPZ68_37850 [Streptomyces arenae]|nr:hypothetical protein [Streptomyces arenae]